MFFSVIKGYIGNVRIDLYTTNRQVWFIIYINFLLLCENIIYYLQLNKLILCFIIMIYIELKGGLGNQLFQIFTGISYAIEYNIPFKIIKTKLI